MKRLLPTALGGGLCALLGSVAPAPAAEVRGQLDLTPPPFDASSLPTVSGYTRIEVARPSRALRDKAPEYALFLDAIDSLPITGQPTPTPVLLAGLEFTPQVVSCPVDGTIVFTNRDDSPRTIQIGGRPHGTAQPGASIEYVCEAGAEGGGLVSVTVDEYGFMSATIFVGDSGVAARPRPDGTFVLTAPQGRYRLEVVAPEGVVLEREVTVDGNVDLGLIVVGRGVKP